MRLVWEHDAGEWDAVSLIGTIVVYGDCGNTIHDNCVTLDDWLVALSQGLLKLRAGASNALAHSTHDPNPIELRREGSECLLKWRDEIVSIGTADRACKDLHTQLQALADDLVKRFEPRDEVAISELIAHVKLLANNCVNRSGESGPN